MLLEVDDLTTVLLEVDDLTKRDFIELQYRIHSWGKMALGEPWDQLQGNGDFPPIHLLPPMNDLSCIYLPCEERVALNGQSYLRNQIMELYGPA